MSLDGVRWDHDAAAALFASPLAAGLTTLQMASTGPFADRELAALARGSFPALGSLIVPAGEWSVAARESAMRAIGPRLGLGSVAWGGRPAREWFALRLRRTAGPRYLEGGGWTAGLTPLDPGPGFWLTLTGRHDSAWPDEAETLDGSGVAALTAERFEATPDWFAGRPKCFPHGLQRLAVADADLRVRHVGPRIAALEALKPRGLDLSRNALGVRSIKPLVESAGADFLEELDLSGNDVQASALAAILASPRLTKRRRLALPTAPLARAARAKFERDKPAGLEVTWG